MRRYSTRMLPRAKSLRIESIRNVRTANRPNWLFATASSCNRAFTAVRHVTLGEEQACRDFRYDGDEPTLEEYEDLLLNSAIPDSVTNVTGIHNLHDLNAGESGGYAAPLRAPQLVNSILDLLPSDGTGLRISTIAQALDVETINEVCGSVLSFVQLFPHRFRCYQSEEADGSLRWYVKRTKPVGSIVPKPAEAHLSKCTEEQSANDGRAPEPVPGGVKLRNFHCEVTEEQKRNFFLGLKGMLPVDKPVATASLLPTLPPELQNFVRSTGGGLLRLLKDTVAEEYVDLSADNTLVSVRGILAQRGLPTHHGAGNCVASRHDLPLVAAFPDYAEDTWDVELDLDGNDSAAEAVDDNNLDYANDSSKIDSNFFGTGSSVVVSVADKVLQDTRMAPPAPPKPVGRDRKRGTPPPIQQEVGYSRLPTKRLSPDDLLRVHTEMALLRGRHLPSQLLELFVECIPTFFIPVQQIKLTDPLARALGPHNTIHKVIKIYSYYFDRDATKDVVRLKPGLQHERLGMANKLYQNGVGATSVAEAACRKLQGTDATRVFPVLQPPLRTARRAPPCTQKERAGCDSSSTSVKVDLSLAGVFNMLEALPHDRYFTEAEWAVSAGVTVESLRVFVEENYSRHYFLTTGSQSQHGDVAKMWRLRPFWLAPDCTGELDENSSTEIAFIVPCLKPFWMPIGKLLQKLPPEHREVVEAVAKEGGGLSSWLRSHGRICWVDESGERVRKYCAEEGLDDVLHIAIVFLKHHATFDHVKLRHIINSCEIHSTSKTQDISKHTGGIRHLIGHSLQMWKSKSEDSKYTSYVSATNQATDEHILPFLLKHTKHLDIKVTQNDIWVAKKSFFRKKT